MPSAPTVHRFDRCNGQVICRDKCISVLLLHEVTEQQRQQFSATRQRRKTQRVETQRSQCLLTIFTCDARVSHDSGFVFSASDLHSKSGLRSGCVLGDFMCKFTFTFVFALPTETCRGCAELADTSPGYIYVPWLKARDLLPAGPVCQTCNRASFSAVSSIADR